MPSDQGGSDGLRLDQLRNRVIRLSTDVGVRQRPVV